MVSYLYMAMALIAILGVGAAVVGYASLLFTIPTATLQRIEHGAVILLMLALIIGVLAIDAGP